MTGWEMNRDTIKAYISTLNLSEELKTALDTAADTCENPTVGDVSRSHQELSESLHFRFVLVIFFDI